MRCDDHHQILWHGNNIPLVIVRKQFVSVSRKLTASPRPQKCSNICWVWFTPTKYWPQCRCPPAPPCRSWPRSRSWWWACSGRSGGGWAPSWPGWPWWWGQGSGSDPLWHWRLVTGCVYNWPLLRIQGKLPASQLSVADSRLRYCCCWGRTNCDWLGQSNIDHTDSLTHHRLLPSSAEKMNYLFWHSGLVTPPLALRGVWNMQTVRAWERQHCEWTAKCLYWLEVNSCSESIKIKRHLYTWHVTRDRM